MRIAAGVEGAVRGSGEGRWVALGGEVSCSGRGRPGNGNESDLDGVKGLDL